METMFLTDCSEDTLITEMVGGESYQYYPFGNYIVRAVGVCRGRPTFKYTRIEITGAIERLASGQTIDELVTVYRGRVSKEAIVEALRLVTSFVDALPELKVAA
jgi:uncharacterized protein (DUF433 family)